VGIRDWGLGISWLLVVVWGLGIRDLGFGIWDLGLGIS